MKTIQGAVSRWLLLPLFVVVLLASGQFFAESAIAATPSGGVLTVGMDISGSINPIEFDPSQIPGPACCFAYDWPIYAGLLRETTVGNYVPDLATSVKIPDPETLDITLRPGLVYSNGTPLDANAVKAAFTRDMANPRPGAFDASFYNLSSIDVSGPASLVLHFNQPVASAFYPLLANQDSFLALPTGPSSGNPNTSVVGAGPFMLKSYAPDARIVLVKNPKYWDAQAIKLSGITFVNVPPGPQQLNTLESGQVDVTVALQNSEIPAVKNSTTLQTNSIFPDASYYLAPICKSSGPLASLQVRQALNYATNREAINKALLLGKGQPAWSIFPSSSPYYDKALTGYYAYNVKKAKHLMAEAGYPHGFSTTLMALPQTTNQQMATVLQAEWKQIGVKATIVSTSNFVTDLFRDHKAQIGLVPQALPGIEKLTTEYSPGTVGNLCGYMNPTLNAVTNAIQATPPTSPKLTSLWKQAQDIIIKNALSLYIDYAPLVTAATKAVKNLQVVPYVGGVVNYWVVSVK